MVIASSNVMVCVGPTGCRTARGGVCGGVFCAQSGAATIANSVARYRVVIDLCLQSCEPSELCLTLLQGLGTRDWGLGRDAISAEEASSGVRASRPSPQSRCPRGHS